MQKIIKIKGHTPLKFKLVKSDMFVVDEIFDKQVYFPRLNQDIDFKLNKSDTVIDIGGNIGVFATYVSKVVSKGKVYSFEPVRRNFKKLLAHKELNNCKNLIAEQVGVSNRRGQAEIHLAIGNTGGHSMNPEKFKKLHEKMSSVSETINLVTLQDIFDKYKIQRCNFLKIDCEGEEFNILKKLPDSYFEKIDKISMEYHPPLDRFEIIKFLESKNFKVGALFGQQLGLIFAYNRVLFK